MAGLAEWIIDQLPVHVYYAEPFAGKAGVYRRKIPALRTWLIDEDEEIVAWLNANSLPGTTVSHGDGIRFCQIAADLVADDQFLLYCDPPYLPSTRVKKKLYKHEMTCDDHKALLDALIRCRFPVYISGYQSELYLDVLSQWKYLTRDVITRGGVMRTEYLWRNVDRPSSSVAMKYSQLGDNFRERQRVKRKAERWSRKMAEMPHDERMAVYLAMVDVLSRESRRNRR